jgi:hypothetical protein
MVAAAGVGDRRDERIGPTDNTLGQQGTPESMALRQRRVDEERHRGEEIRDGDVRVANGEAEVSSRQVKQVDAGN